MANAGHTGTTTEGKRIALVTGVGRREGIGFEVCRQLAAKGFGVVLTARTYDKARALAELLVADGLDVTPVALEIADDASRRAAVEHVRARFGGLDVLVNNGAGAGRMGETVSSADLADARAAFETTVFGSWAVIQAFLPLLRASRHARIVNVSSGAGSQIEAGGRGRAHGRREPSGEPLASMNRTSSRRRGNPRTVTVTGWPIRRRAGDWRASAPSPRRGPPARKTT